MEVEIETRASVAHVREWLLESRTFAEDRVRECREVSVMLRGSLGYYTICNLIVEVKRAQKRLHAPSKKLLGG
jgi:hypothetical protein